MKIIGNKWVFRLKYDSEGRMERHKTRLVAKRFLQIPGVDYGETFGPIIKASTLEIILTLAVSRDWHIRQVDVYNAFLNVKLNEMVYIHQPQGLVGKKNPNFTCKLEELYMG